MKPPLFTFMFASTESSFPIHSNFLFFFVLSRNQLSFSGVLLNDYGLLIKKKKMLKNVISGQQA